MTTTIALPDESATRRLGAALAAGITTGRSLFLGGELGAGKTTLVRAMLRTLGYAGRVRSPTYSLLELYSISSLNLYHFDFYRLRGRTEWTSSGFREYFNPDSVCIVEWAERVTSLPDPDLEILLEFSGGARKATLRASSRAGREWLDAVWKRLRQA